MSESKAETTKLYLDFRQHRCAVCGNFIGYTEVGIQHESILCSEKCRDEWIEGRINHLKAVVGG